MKKFLLSVLCAAALLLGGACEKIIEFHGPQVEPQLTMSSQATVGEPLRAYFSTSVFFLDSDRNGQAFKDKLDPALASVRCYVNGDDKGMEMALNKDMSFSSYCFEADYVPAPGDRIRLEAQFPGFDPVWAETTVPRMPQFELLSVEWKAMESDLAEFFEDEETSYEVTVMLAVTDDGSYDKYYFLQPAIRYSTDWIEEEVWVSATFSSNDIVFQEAKGGAAQLFGSSGYYFSDALIKGQRHVFTIQLTYMPAPETLAGMGIRVASANEDLYWYDWSYGQVAGGFAGIFTEGVTLYSNVNGGYGVFCAVAPAWLDVEL